MWVLALIGAFVLTAVQFVLVVFEAALVWCEGLAGSYLIESYHAQNTLTVYLLGVVYILIPCGFLIAWVTGTELYEGREAVIGKVCDKSTESVCARAVQDAGVASRCRLGVVFDDGCVFQSQACCESLRIVGFVFWDTDRENVYDGAISRP